MDIKIAYNDPQGMSQDGDAILRSLQNKSLPMIDLMVRESIQNSLDATLPNQSETKVNFSVGQFESEQLSKHFEEIQTILNTKYSGSNTFISVSDKNTSGLTGDFRTTDSKSLDKSNFQKLVFGIGKNQEKDGAGGSWGLGKTSYFRMGVGIVIYYTRVKVATGYEERLIVSLIESPKNKDRLLPQSGRGIAWWGEFSKENADIIYPITNSNKIQSILDIFGLQQYNNDETGTLIIVPYIKNTINEAKDTEDTKNFWEEDIPSKITMAVQRWYSPRIWNSNYQNYTQNSLLNCSVNDIPIINLEPTFNVIRELYSSAVTQKASNDKITIEPIKLPRTGMEKKEIPIGYLAFGEFERNDFKMTPPNNKPSPIKYIGEMNNNESDAINKKKSVIAYTRKPGMIVEYSVDGEWVPQNLSVDDDHILFGIFVPNSTGKLHESHQEKGYFNLEQYLRAVENADHANWVDEDGTTLVQRIKKYSSNCISEYYQENAGQEYSSAVAGLSRKFGQLMMPPKSFGKASTVQNKSKINNQSKTKNRLSDITVLSTKLLDESTAEVKFKVSIKQKNSSKLFVNLITQDGFMSRSEWIKNMGNQIPFPIQIKDMILLNVSGDKLNTSIRNFEDDNLEFYFDEANGEYIEIKTKLSEGIQIEGNLILDFFNKDYLPSLAIKTNNTK